MIPENKIPFAGEGVSRSDGVVVAAMARTFLPANDKFIPINANNFTIANSAFGDNIAHDFNTNIMWGSPRVVFFD